MKVEKLNLELLPVNIIVHLETDYYGLLASEEATVINKPCVTWIVDASSM